MSISLISDTPKCQTRSRVLCHNQSLNLPQRPPTSVRAVSLPCLYDTSVGRLGGCDFLDCNEIALQLPASDAEAWRKVRVRSNSFIQTQCGHDLAPIGADRFADFRQGVRGRH